jgi:CheY-like chemotaxis protein
MSERSFRVLVVDDEESIRGAIAAVLRRRGHDVTTATNAIEALRGAACDVLVSDLALADGSGLELLAAMHERGLHPHTVFVTGTPTLEDCRRALHLGAADFLTKPFRLGDLVRAVESFDPPESAEKPAFDPARNAFSREYVSTGHAVESAARDLSAFALACGIGPSGRARIASGAGEIVDNARRHGYVRSRGKIRVEAELVEREFIVRIADDGVGFDPHDGGARYLESTLENGLARAMALSEDIRVDTAPGTGTRVTLRFASTRVEFDEDAGIDLSELDYLTPDMSRRVLHALQKNASSSTFRLSPALAVVVGRLLCGPDPRVAVQKALWSA